MKERLYGNALVQLLNNRKSFLGVGDLLPPYQWRSLSMCMADWDNGKSANKRAQSLSVFLKRLKNLVAVSMLE